MTDLRLEYRDPATLADNGKNWRKHPKLQMDALEGVIAEVGWAGALLYNEQTDRLIDGHARKKLPTKGELVPVLIGSWTEEQEAKILLTFDPIGAMAEQDSDALAALLETVRTDNASVQGLLDSLQESSLVEAALPATDEPTPPRPTLADRFLVPPFSVLDARQGYWQERKRQWLALGIRSELGRGDQVGTSARARPGEDPTYRQIASNGLLGESEQTRSHYTAAPGGSLRPATTLGANGKTQRGDGTGKVMAEHTANGKGPARTFGQDLMRGEHTVGDTGKRADSRAIKDHAWQARLTWVAGNRDYDDLDEASRKILAAQPQSGTSIFDPVLCELAYRWFCPPAGRILDTFAGGSVRGIVAAALGRAYTGIDLSERQIAANREQAAEIGGEWAIPPAWIAGDSTNVADLAPGEYDLLFTCPPYGDLETYSDDPADISTMPYADFLTALRVIVAASAAMLKPDRFAAIVVGDIRDTKGMYRNFVSDTIAAYQSAGLALYNEAILVTAVGSLPIRVGRQFESGRKLGKTHQNVLVFVKGDPKKATAAVGPVDVTLDDLGASSGGAIDPSW